MQRRGAPTQSAAVPCPLCSELGQCKVDVASHTPRMSTCINVYLCVCVYVSVCVVYERCTFDIWQLAVAVAVAVGGQGKLKN